MIEPDRILVVEDQSTNRLLLRAVLSRGDPRLRAAVLLEAETVAEARAILARERIDLILLDIRLPDGSGLDIARELAADGEPGPRVIILSASVLPEERAVALEAGGDAFMGKPFRPAELQRLIGELLDGSPARRGSIS